MSYSLTDKINEHSYKTHGASGNSVYEMWHLDWAGKIRHRLDGPAVTVSELALPGDKGDVRHEWWYMNKKIPCSSQEEFNKWLCLKVFW